MDLQKNIPAIAASAALAFSTACGGFAVQPVPQPDPAPDPGVGEASVTVSPTTGTTDTNVTLEGSGFVPNSTVRIGFGPPQSEFEVLGTATADASGMVRATVEVPDWADEGESYVFVADGAEERAISPEFRVTATGQAPGDEPGSQVRVTGVLTEEGVECQALRADNGQLYTFTADTGQYDSGDRVTVEGEVVEASFCMQGTTLRVEQISGTQ